MASRLEGSVDDWSCRRLLLLLPDELLKSASAAAELCKVTSTAFVVDNSERAAKELRKNCERTAEELRKNSRTTPEHLLVMYVLMLTDSSDQICLKSDQILNTAHGASGAMRQ